MSVPFTVTPPLGKMTGQQKKKEFILRCLSILPCHGDINLREPYSAWRGAGLALPHPWTLIWLQMAAQTRNLHMGFVGNRDR